jgi:hypothetical protein
MAIKRFNDTSNARDKRETPASSVPQHSFAKGEPCGGTANTRADHSAPPSQRPAKGSGSDHRPSGPSFKDRNV